ncbi:MAG: hypothetical protein ACXVA9_04255 [Bdellovibrionales bacterium]
MSKFLIGLVFVSSMAQAADMACVETAKSKKENAYDAKVTINVNKDGKSLWIQVKPNDGSKAKSAVADRNDENTRKGSDFKDGTYNLDEEYNRKEEARFVTSKWDIATSDADSIIFVEKSILKGKPGKIAFSGGQANEGDSGDPWLWNRDAEFSCK